MGCVLRVWGRDFDVDEFLNRSSLEPLTIWHAGESQSPISVPAAHPQLHSGMHVSVSIREFSDLSGQIKDAESFLRTHNEELLRLRDFSGIESSALDFPVESRDVAVQTDTFPPSLLGLMGQLKITLAISHYPTSE